MQERELRKLNKFKPNTVFLLCLYLFFFLLVFDPSDSIFNFKIPLFIILFALTIIDCLRFNGFIEKKLVIIVFSFILLIVVSSVWGRLLNYNFNLDFAFSKIKSMIFLALALFLGIYRYDFNKCLIRILMLLNLVIIGIAIIVSLDLAPNFADFLYSFGNKHTSFTFQFRNYAGINFPSIYFHSSPMLSFCIGYYAAKLFKSNKKNFIVNLILYVISFAGIFLTGSRNNMIFSVAISLLVWLFLSKNKLLTLSIYFSLFIAILLLFSDIILAFFDPKELSNSIKISMAKDYINLFKDNPLILFLGEGVGSGFLCPVKGGIVEITELSYFDMLRWFGIFGSIICLGLMVYPIFRILNRRQRHLYWILASYIGFLIMIFSNPFFFNSVGITLYSLILYSTIQKKEKVSSLYTMQKSK